MDLGLVINNLSWLPWNKMAQFSGQKP